ncbi:MAG: SH3 domain-containing protein [Anaerolineae bacterium]|nr:SH3 domain-containing protein [Anaerolineae bacterium]
MSRRIGIGQLRILRIFVLAALLVGAAGAVMAQGGMIGYGQSLSGALTAEAPFSLYTFNGSAGDHITAYVAGATDGMRPTLSLLSPTQRQLAVSAGDPLLGGDGNLARITYRLQETGMHTLMVTNAAGTPGEYLLHLSAGSSAVSMSLPPNSPASFNIPPGAQPVRYSFNALPDAPLTLLITSDSPGFAYSAQVYDGQGQPVAQLGGAAIQGTSLIIGPDNGLYEISVSGLRPESQGAVTLLLSSGGVSPDSTPVPVVTATPANCQVAPQGNTRINIRSGPSTAFPIVAQLAPGTSQEVIGQSSDGTWYVINVAGRRGWVAGSVTVLEGTCSSLPFFESPPTPTPAPATPTPTPPPGAVINFTVNGTGSANVWPGGCATVEWYTENIREVYYEGTGVSGVGSREECPAATKTYTLRVVMQDGTETTRNVAIVVADPPMIVTLPPMILTPMIIVTLAGP